MRFLRKDTNKYLRLGSKRKKSRKWRRARGKHNAVREKRKGYVKKVEIGYKKKKEERKAISIIKNMKELENFKGKEAILSNVGKRKRQIMLDKAKELKIEFLNWK